MCFQLRLLWVYWRTLYSTSHLNTDSSLPQMQKTCIICKRQEFVVQWPVTGWSWVALVLVVRVLDAIFSSAASWLSGSLWSIDRWKSWLSLKWRISEKMVLNAELKSTNRIPEYIPQWLRWNAVLCQLHASPAYLLGWQIAGCVRSFRCVTTGKWFHDHRCQGDMWFDPKMEEWALELYKCLGIKGLCEDGCKLVSKDRQEG